MAAKAATVRLPWADGRDNVSRNMAAQVDHTDQLVIFDLDGTLYDSRTSFVPTMRAVYEEYGLEYPTDSIIMRSVGEPFPVFLNWLIEHGFQGDRDALAGRISEIELASIRTRGKLFPGVLETLATLRSSGYSISLCTNGDMQYAQAVLSTCDILDLFDELRTNEVEGTTKTELVRDLLLHVPHERAFMVGDRHHDMQAGRANGCIVIAAAYGYGSPEELEGADRRINSFSEISAALDASAGEPPATHS